MHLRPTPIDGCFRISLEPYYDERGAFSEGFVQYEWMVAGIGFNVDQVNFSRSTKAGTIRGLHWQNRPHAQGKIVYSMRGTIFDAVVDVRKDSKTFGVSYWVELTPMTGALFVPKGLAHGFQALEDDATLMYLVDSPYMKSAEGGLRYDDPSVAIPWPLKPVNVAQKDLNWPTFDSLR